MCDTVVLDRHGPTLAINASNTVVRTGEQVSFSADASDSGSGIDTSTPSWEFGDGTRASAGGTVSHSFDQPGTYVVRFRAKDQVGNESTAQKSITVEAPPSDVTTPPGGPTPPGVEIGAVRVSVPKTLRLRKTKQLVLRAKSEQTGVLTLRLTRGKKVYSRLTVGLAPGETTQRLRLPRGLKRGTYTVKIAFKAAGAGYTTTRTARIVIR